MPTNDLSQITTTNMQGTVPDVAIASVTPDGEATVGEFVWDYPDAAQNNGYYKIAQINSMYNALATWTTGLGWETDLNTKVIFENMTGAGQDSFEEIIWNLQVAKKVFGDSFAEIIRNDKGGLINLKPLYTGNMRSVWNDQGIIIRYEQRNKKGGNRKLRTDQVLHLMNNRVANEVHGQTIVSVLKDIIDAKKEAFDDERTIRHRELLGVLEVDTNDPVKIAKAVTTYQKAVKFKEMLVQIKGTSEIKDNPMTHSDRIQWMTYLDNLFYQVGGVPKVIVTSEGFTEAGGKVGFLTFEPIYTREQKDLESDLWNQIAKRVKFNRPPSLSGMMQESEDKNTGQTGIQPNETQVSATRTE